MVGRTMISTPRYGVRIVTVDPTQGLIEGVFKTGDVRQISVYTTPPAFRWPQVGEDWMVRQENGTWYLDGFWPNSEAPNQLANVAPGDLVLNSPTGVIHVFGSSDGSSDFSLTQPVCGIAILSSGTAVVPNPQVRGDSLIFLTAQDNLSTGALRVSSRIPGTSFTIVSSNSSDKGIVAYQIVTNPDSSVATGVLSIGGTLMTIKTGP